MSDQRAIKCRHTEKHRYLRCTLGRNSATGTPIAENSCCGCRKRFSKEIKANFVYWTLPLPRRPEAAETSAVHSLWLSWKRLK